MKSYLNSCLIQSPTDDPILESIRDEWDWHITARRDVPHRRNTSS